MRATQLSAISATVLVMKTTAPERWALVARLLVLTLLTWACGCSSDTGPDLSGRTVPHESRWGIYLLDLATEEVSLVHSAAGRITSLRLHPDGQRLVCAVRLDGDEYEHEEICILRSDGSGFRRLTENGDLDTYPAWSPDGTRIAFLSMREGTLDIFTMDTLGSAQELLYDSGGHDADIDWGVRGIAFTRQSCIWMMDADGSNDHAVTDWDSAGIWGDAVLPFGDYDPRIHPDSSWIVFSRLVDDASSHGIYEIMRLDLESDDLLPLTGQPWTQGFASWSHDGTRIVFVVAAIAGEGQYRIYEMDAGGAGLRNITPDYFPQTLLCHAPIFTPDDRAVYFAGEWWE